MGHLHDNMMTLAHPMTSAVCFGLIISFKRKLWSAKLQYSQLIGKGEIDSMELVQKEQST
ncbi:hypothetical protein DAI22_05g263550 [Oryza sativa Japonica Group]|nr:hypothetical protein DAI22_05g263550 [Oryza sativa Japonica Group]